MLQSLINWFKGLFGRAEDAVEDIVEEVQETVEEVQEDLDELIDEFHATVTELQKMTKTELDIYARKIGLILSKRKNKNTMIDDIISKLNEEN